MTRRKIFVTVLAFIMGFLLTFVYFKMVADKAILGRDLQTLGQIASQYSVWFSQRYWANQKTEWQGQDVANFIQRARSPLASLHTQVDEDFAELLDGIVSNYRTAKITWETALMREILSDLALLGQRCAFPPWSSQDTEDYLAESFKEVGKSLKMREFPKERALRDLLDRLNWYALWLKEPNPWLSPIRITPGSWHDWAGSYQHQVMKDILRTAQSFSDFLISLLCRRSEMKGEICHYQFSPTVIGGSKTPPRDLDGDGLYEDVNGNGVLDFNDYVTLNANKRSRIVQLYAHLFDYNRDGDLDDQDLEELRGMIVSGS